MEENPERGKLLQTAKLSEQAERYDDMSIAMRKVAEMGCPLSQEERNLLSVAYKNLVGSRRTSWRILNTAIERVDGEKGDGKMTKEHRKELAIGYTKKIEDELQRICEEVLTLLNDVLLVDLPDAAEAEAVEDRVFYLKMKADYYRYIAEIKLEEAKKSYVENAKAAYTTAMELSQSRLAVLHPIRLGLSLNCSVFYYEILNDRSRACELAQQAYDDALVELNENNEDSYKDSTLIMQLLRDNLQFWRDDEQGE